MESLLATEESVALGRPYPPPLARIGLLHSYGSQGSSSSSSERKVSTEPLACLRALAATALAPARAGREDSRGVGGGVDGGAHSLLLVVLQILLDQLRVDLSDVGGGS